MLGYILLFLSIALAFAIKSKEKQLLFIFVALTVFSGLRYGIGYDYYSYLDSCLPGSYRIERYEFIPQQMAILSQNTFPYLFFILTSIFISFFYYLGTKKGGRDYYYEAIFYICFPFLFFNQLGVIRQAMASSVVFYAITLNHDLKFFSKEQIVRLLFLVVAFLCHTSALVAILILFPWHKVNKALLWTMFIFSFFLGIVLTPLLEAYIHVLDFLGEETTNTALSYLSNENEGEGRLIKYLIYAVAVFSLILYDKLVNRDSKNAFYIGVLILGASMFAIFSFNSSLAKRFCIFFFSSSIFIVPQIVRLLKIPHILYVSVMTFLLSFLIYLNSNNTRPEDRNGSSVSYPYRTFINQQ